MSNTDGFGQMLPPNTGSQVDHTFFQTELFSAKMRTMIPVRVVKVYKQDGTSTATRGDVAGAGFVDVQPMVSQTDGNNQRMDHVTVYHVPYTRMYGGDFAVISDPVAGDVGYIHCSDRDISAFKDQVKQGSTTNVLPGSRRRHDMADSIYMGGVLNNTPKQYITVTDKGITINDVNNNKIVMNDTGITITDKNNNKIEMLSGGITLTATTVTVKGDFKSTGAVIAGSGGGDQVTLQTHTHGGVTTGSGNTVAPNAGT